jgi:hypothetical protein
VIAPPLTLLLHGNGLDELIMIGVGLALAFLVISFTGRESAGGPEGDEDEARVDEHERRAP